jgi:alpha-amylase
VIQGEKSEDAVDRPLPLLKRLVHCSLPFILCFLLLQAGCAGKSKIPAAQEPPPQAAPIEAPAREFVSWPDSVIYFVIVDRFADGDPSNNSNVDKSGKGTFHGGDLKGLIANLDQISDLGASAIWITPVVKNIDGFVTGAGFPDWGYHGYWADDFYQIDPRFGTEADLKTLVDECHKRGIRLLLDVVYNHAGYESHYLTDPKTKEWFRSESLGTCGTDDLTSCLAGLPDFKTELPEVADYLMTAHLSLAKRTGLDGFRLDTVKHVQHAFWQEHRQRIRKEIGQNFFLIGEVWGGDPQVLDPWFEGDEMDSGFDFSFQGNVVSFLLGRGRTIAFDRYLKQREKTRKGYLISHFLSSHDVPGALMQLNYDTDLFRLAALLQFTSIGTPVIYYGEEVARRGGDWPDNRSDMPWGEMKIEPGTGQPRDETLRTDYKRLLEIRKQHPALSRGIHTALSTEGDLLVFSQSEPDSNDTVIVAVNRGATAASAKVPLPANWSGALIKDIWNGENIAASGTEIELSVPPKSARIVTAQSTGNLSFWLTVRRALARASPS